MKVKFCGKKYYARRQGNKTYLYRNILYYLFNIANPSLSVVYQIEHKEL